MPDSRTTDQQRNLGTDVICVVFLLIAGLKWAWNLPAYNDFLFGDEAEYMRNGLDLFATIRNDWGPSYNIWYKLLSVITSDPVLLYYLNYIAGALIAAGLLYIGLRRFSIQPLIAVYLSFCFLISDLNINTWPRVSHFIIILLLCAMILAARCRSLAIKGILFSGICFIAAYARPDLLLAFFFLFTATLYFIFRERQQFKKLIPLLLGLSGVIIFFQGVFGLPASDYRGEVDRLYIAFGQHFTINYKMRTGKDMDAVTDWLVFCREYFPGCHTLGDILKNHFSEVVQHSMFNLKNYLLTLLNTAGSFIFPIKILHYKKLSYLALAGLAGASAYIIYHKQKRQAWYGWLRENWLSLGFLFLVGLTSIGMCILIFPRQHYIILHSLFLIFLIASIAHSLFKLPAVKWYILIPLFACIIYFAPKASRYSYMQVNSDTRNLCSQKMIRYLEKKTDRPYIIFSSILNISYPLPKNFSEFNTEYELREGMNFSGVLRDKKINLILVTDNLLKNPVLRNDSTWSNFLEAPESHGFKKINYHEICESYLLIKDSSQ
jgi:hypothetical protein